MSAINTRGPATTYAWPAFALRQAPDPPPDLWLAMLTCVRFSNLGVRNDIGLPLTVLRLRAHHRLAVLELGMNHPGETVYLAGIAQPTVAVITNAQREHQEFMVSVEAVAHEHASAIAALPADGVAVFPVDAEGGGEQLVAHREAAQSGRKPKILPHQVAGSSGQIHPAPHRSCGRYPLRIRKTRYSPCYPTYRHIPLAQE